MLYDPKWGKDDIWSLPRFIAWLEKQPSDGTYHYCSSGNCLIAKYLTACGLTGVIVTPCWATAAEKIWPRTKGRNYPVIFDNIAHSHPSLKGNWQNSEWSFGQALKRAQRALTLELAKAI